MAAIHFVNAEDGFVIGGTFEGFDTAIKITNSKRITVNNCTEISSDSKSEIKKASGNGPILKPLVLAIRMSLYGYV